MLGFVWCLVHRLLYACACICARVWPVSGIQKSKDSVETLCQSESGRRRRSDAWRPHMETCWSGDKTAVMATLCIGWRWNLFTRSAACWIDWQMWIECVKLFSFEIAVVAVVFSHLSAALSPSWSDCNTVVTFCVDYTWLMVCIHVYMTFQFSRDGRYIEAMCVYANTYNSSHPSAKI